MSRHGEVTLEWGDGEYPFRLGYRELMELQRVCDGGPDWIAGQIHSVHCRVEYVRETLRLGLIGGGMKQSEALGKVRSFFEEQMGDYDNNRLIAWAIIESALRPIDGSALKKTLGAATKKRKGSRTEKSISTASSASPLQ
jgi:hypothetical protein